MSNKKKRLGRGLDAFFNGDEGLESMRGSEELINNIEVEKIKPNPYQPRESFEKEGLEELAASIEENGVLQPLILTPRGDEGYYIVAGERRWRAAKMAKKKEVPAIIREFEEDRMLEIALIENIHRDDLNPLEEARAYSQLLERLEVTQNELAEKIGKSRSGISNSLRLLKLPAEIQKYVSRGTLSAGQARALAGLDDPDQQREVAEEIISRDMSVRETEKHIAGLKEKADGNERNRTEADQMLDGLEELLDRSGEELQTETNINLKERDSEVEAQEWERYSRKIEEITGLQVRVEREKEKLKVEVSCSGLEELQHLLSLLEG